MYKIKKSPLLKNKPAAERVYELITVLFLFIPVLIKSQKYHQ